MVAFTSKQKFQKSGIP